MQVLITGLIVPAVVFLIFIIAGCQQHESASPASTTPQVASATTPSFSSASASAGSKCLEPGLYKGMISEFPKEFLVISVTSDCLITGTATNHPSEGARLRGFATNYRPFTAHIGPDGLPEIQTRGGNRYSSIQPCGSNFCGLFCNQDRNWNPINNITYICNYPFQLIRQ